MNTINILIRIGDTLRVQKNMGLQGGRWVGGWRGRGGLEVHVGPL